ncbi:MAG TPA: CATRA system-associated protein [Nonomuraea sp.]|nr:CATRA system-associated protein [Nonomuraea sp.]
MIKPDTAREADEALDWLIEALLAPVEWDRVTMLLDDLSEALAGDDDRAVMDAAIALDHVLQRGEWEEIEEDESEPGGECAAPEKVRERFNKLKHTLSALRNRRDGEE